MGGLSGSGVVQISSFEIWLHSSAAPVSDTRISRNSTAWAIRYNRYPAAADSDVSSRQRIRNSCIGRPHRRPPSRTLPQTAPAHEARTTCSGAQGAAVRLSLTDNDALVAWQHRLCLSRECVEWRQRPFHPSQASPIFLTFQFTLFGVRGYSEAAWFTQLDRYGGAELDCANESAESI